MKLDLRDFKTCIPNLKFRLEANKPDDLEGFITEFSSSTFVPIVAVCYYVKFINNTDELEPMIQRLVDFYKYTDILGFEEL